VSDILQFIPHSNVQEVLQHLDEMLMLDEDGKSPGIYFLLAHQSAGKERITREWMRGSHLDGSVSNLQERPRIVCCTTWKPLSNRLGSKNYATAITCVTFTELTYALGKIAEAYPATYASKQWYRKPKSLYTDRQFTSLFAFLRTEIDRLRVRAIVIHNAPLIDDNTLEMLVLLRHHCHDALSFVLVGDLLEKAEIDEPLEGAFRHVAEAAAICRREQLQQLTVPEFKKVVLPALSEQLSLTFAADLLAADVVKLVPNALWKYTKSNWDVIDRLAKALTKVPQGRDGLRIIDRKTLEAILGKPLMIESTPRANGRPSRDLGGIDEAAELPSVQ
jgi:hypothetical protein